MKQYLLSFFLLSATFSGAQTIEMVQDLNPTGSSIPAFMTELNGEIVFRAGETLPNFELYGSDGETIYLIEEIRPGSSSSAANSFINFNNKVYFNANDGTAGLELWSYDGNNATLEIDYDNGPNSSFFANNIVFNGKLYVLIDNGSIGSELYSYDGTNSPTLVSDINLTPGAGSSITEFTLFNNELYFVATDSSNATEIYRYDGTNPPVKTTNFGYQLPINNLIVYDGKLIFSAYNTLVNPNNGVVYELDATNNLQLLISSWTGTEPLDFQDPIVFNGKLYFNAFDDNTMSGNVWMYDGISAPAAIHPFSMNNPVEYNGYLYFGYWDAVAGAEIHKFDGTNYPELLSDIVPGITSTPFDNPVVINNVLYFRGTDGTPGAELMKLDCNSDSSYIQIACNSFTSPSGNHTWTTSGIYQDTLGNHMGCDSLLTIDLSLFTIDTSVTVSANEITANTIGGAITYQWIDCATGQNIQGETGQTLQLTSNGEYAVVINNGSCSDTSSCILIDALGIPEENKSRIRLAPNPTNTQFMILGGATEGTINIMDLKGLLMIAHPFAGNETISVEHLPAGTYVVKIETDHGIFHDKLLIQR